MSNIDAKAQDVMLKLTDCLSAIQACQVAVAGAESAVQLDEAGAGASLALMASFLAAVSPYPQRFSDMIGAIQDANNV